MKTAKKAAKKVTKKASAKKAAKKVTKKAPAKTTAERRASRDARVTHRVTTVSKKAAKKVAKKAPAKKVESRLVGRVRVSSPRDRPLYDSQNQPITPQTPVLSTGDEYKAARMRLAVAFKAKLAAVRLGELVVTPAVWFEVAFAQMIERDRHYAYDSRAIVKLRSELGKVVKPGLTRVVNGYAYANGRLERMTGWGL